MSGQNQNRTLTAGSQLAHYEILGSLGAGGMGEVYRARDKRLGRDVAIKILPSQFATDSVRLRRFEAEACAASALNHPNIVTVYDVGSSDGTSYIAMEFIDGKTLRELIQKGAIPFKKTIPIACQIAEGLARAHAAGIIHRDLKPENIIVTKDGFCKILDFGLAKTETLLEDNSSKLSTVARTEPGHILGSIGYMSPEQASGQPVNFASDQFSFGAILYEMITGQRAFKRKTAAETLAAIINEEPAAISLFDVQTTPQIRSIVDRCLSKSPDDRYGSTHDLAKDLQNARNHLSAEVSEVITKQKTSSTWKFFIPILISIAILGFVAYKYILSKRQTLPTKLTKISHWDKPILSAALSPDGNTIAFSSFVGGNAQIFVMLVAGGEPLQLTRDEGDKVVNAFSRDGTEIYYARVLGRDEIWGVPTLGGIPRRILVAYHLVPSLDGKSYFYFKDPGTAIFSTAVSEFKEEEVYSVKLPFRPLFILPYEDGFHLLLIVGLNVFDDLHFIKVDVLNHKGEEIAKVPRIGEYPHVDWWERGKSVLLSRSVNGITNLWIYDLLEHSYTQVTSGPGEDISAIHDPHGKGIYFVSGRFAGPLIAYDVKTRMDTEIVDGETTQPTISPDKKKVMYLKQIGRGIRDVWVCDLDGKNKIKIASQGYYSTLDWSRDSLRVSFMDNTKNKAYIVGADGQRISNLDYIDDDLSWAIWAADGKRMYISTVEKNDRGNRKIWEADLNGKHINKFSDSGFFVTDSTPDGEHLVGFLAFGPETGVYEMSTKKKIRVPVSPGVETYYVHVSNDGNKLLYPVGGRGETIFYQHEWINGQLKERPTIALKVPISFPLELEGNTFDFSRDLSTIVYSRPGGQSDFYLLSYK